MTVNTKKVTIIIRNEYAIGYLKYGGISIYAEMGPHKIIWESMQEKQLYYKSKYSFYEQK